MQRSACASVVLCAWLVRVPALRSGQTNNGTLATFQPAFMACDDEELCRAGETYELDLLRSVADRARSIAASGATPTLLQIGLDGLRNNWKFSDVDLYQELALLLNLSDVRGVLVDAKAEQNGLVWQNLKQTTMDPAKVHVLNGLVMGKCEAANMSMFGFSHRIQEVFGVDTAYTGWVRAHGGKQQLVRVLKAWARDVMPVEYPWAEQWRAMAALPDDELLKYVDETPYRCFTPSDLLAEAGADAGSLAMVVVDAEGEDTSIVGALAEMPNFKPGFLQFEGRYSESAETVSALQGLGFRVGSTAFRKGGGESFNVIAVQPLLG